MERNSSRMCFSLWLLMALILSYGYSGQIESFLVYNPQSGIENLTELTRNSEIKLLINEDYRTHVIIKTEKYWPYNVINNRLTFIKDRINDSQLIEVANGKAVFITNTEYAFNYINSLPE